MSHSTGLGDILNAYRLFNADSIAEDKTKQQLAAQQALWEQQSRQNAGSLQNLGIGPETRNAPLITPSQITNIPNQQFSGTSPLSPLEATYARMGANPNFTNSIYPQLVSGSLSNQGAMQRHITPNATQLATQPKFSAIQRTDSGLFQGVNQLGQATNIPHAPGFTPEPKYHSPLVVNQVGGPNGYELPPGYMLANPKDYTQGVVPIPGGPKQKLTPEQAGKMAATRAAERTFRAVHKTLITPNGKVDRQAVISMNAGVPFTDGRTTNAQFKDIINTKFRSETGAAAPPHEMTELLERYQPSVLDSDATIKDKLERFGAWAKDVNAIADPTSSFGKKPSKQKRKKTPEEQEQVDNAFKELGVP